MIKKAAICVYLFSGYVALRDMILSLLGKSRATVLYYHRIGDSRDPLTRSLDDFRNDLGYLQKHYECISLADLRDRLRSGRAFRRRAVAITFDDGYRNNYTEAARVLKETGMTATFFVATGYIGTDRQFPHDECRDGVAANWPKLTWDDLRA
ncbi:MAG: polysaccharide deacetylase family protein, partial [Blastocatellia bacterium]